MRSYIFEDVEIGFRITYDEETTRKEIYAIYNACPDVDEKLEILLEQVNAKTLLLMRNQIMNRKELNRCYCVCSTNVHGSVEILFICL